MNKKALISLAICILITLTFCGCLEKHTNPQSDFIISDLTVNPKEVKSGKEVKVTVKVSNIGSQANSHIINLYLDNKSYSSEEVYLLAGEKINVSFNILKESIGDHQIQIGNLTDTLTIKQFSLEKVKDLSLTSKAGYIRLNWSLVEDAESYKVYRSVDGKEKLIDTTKNTFYIDEKCSYQEKYTYQISAIKNKLEGKKSNPMEGQPRYDIEVINLTISPKKSETGENININATVYNKINKTLNYTIDLVVDGKIENSKKLTIEAKDQIKSSFSLKKDIPKNYTIRIGNLVGSFEVIKPQKGEIQVQELSVSPKTLSVPPPGLPGYKEISNITVNVSVTNNKDFTITDTLKIYINDKLTKTDELTLKSGEQRLLTYSFKIKQEGSYLIKVRDLKTEFKVVLRM
ncbi:MAG: Cell surface protein [Candidatus Methanohalarchaeum thermophilum]|uniref:Cell surface protein n=1 Tax=Methanohalarchaeum thermophilum TaxID=1903181 RepID=A0A1Q6DX46_METT1|nr:MAG: Cell surface protein [Candidatus Methanohalarchaeum thermophilum]